MEKLNKESKCCYGAVKLRVACCHGALCKFAWRGFGCMCLCPCKYAQRVLFNNKSMHVQCTGGFVNGTDGVSTGETSLDLSFVQHERSYLLHLAIGGIMFDKVQVLLQYGADTNVAREVSCVLICRVLGVHGFERACAYHVWQGY